jgi:hypothetical protein
MLYLDNTIAVASTVIFKWESSSTTIGPTTVKAGFTCPMQLTTGASTNPYYQPGIGRITANYTNYFFCTIAPTVAATKQSFVGALSTWEAWFRFDPIESNWRPDGYLSTVFALYDNSASAYRLGFSVSNRFFRVYVGSTIHDVSFLFNDTTTMWHNIAISYIRKHEKETLVLIYVDAI